MRPARKSRIPSSVVSLTRACISASPIHPTRRHDPIARRDILHVVVAQKRHAHEARRKRRPSPRRESAHSSSSGTAPETPPPQTPAPAARRPRAACAAPPGPARPEHPGLHHRRLARQHHLHLRRSFIPSPLRASSCPSCPSWIICAISPSVICSPANFTNHRSAILRYAGPLPTSCATVLKPDASCIAACASFWLSST